MTRCRWSANVSRLRSPIRAQTSSAQRLGRDHQRVDRCEGPAQPGQLGGEALGGADHDLGADPAVRGASRRRARSRSPACARARSRPSRSTARARPRTSRAGWIGRAVRRVRRPEHAGCGQPGARLVGAEQREVVLAEAPPRASATSARARSSCTRRARDDDRAALGELAVDALGRDDPRRPRRRSPASRGAARRPARSPYRAASQATDAGNSAEHQPPLRPLAPKPATSRSSTTMRSDGSARAGSRPSTARCSRRRRSRRRRRGRPAAPAAAPSRRRRCRARATGAR